MTDHPPLPPDPAAGEARRLGAHGALAFRVGVAAAAVGFGGAAAIAAGGGDAGWARFAQSYLLSFLFTLTICLGALFFVILQHLTRAGWSVTVRRVAEGLAMNLWLVALLAVPVLLWRGELFAWLTVGADGHGGHDPLAAKRWWLDDGFFIARTVGVLLVWAGLAAYFRARSVAQDATGDPRLTARMERASPAAMIVFALTITVAAFDLIMALDAHWYSTVFGVYVFSGAALGGFALLAATLWGLQRQGLLRHSVTDEHYHDLGKLVFAFVVFWAYIAFSQYMLIWYANLPEETGWLARRQRGPWAGVSLALLFGHFVLPFLALISRVPKRRKNWLVLGAMWVLAMHWLDLYWLVMPAFHPDEPPFGLLDLACLAGFMGVLKAGAAWHLGRHALIPERDPRLGEALAFENT